MELWLSSFWTVLLCGKHIVTIVVSLEVSFSVKSGGRKFGQGG